MTEEQQNTSEIVNRRKKKITLSTEGGRKWTGEFSGDITHKDIHILQRVMRVEFAKVTRARSLQRMLNRQKQEREQEKTQKLLDLIEQHKTKENSND